MKPSPTFAPSYAHLSALTDGRGVFERAEDDLPRRDRGYCADDAARALIVVSREPDQTPELAQLAEVYLRFLEQALGPDGRLHNRMRRSGAFTDVPGTGDWWGRAIWALGEVHAAARSTDHRRRAARAFAVAARTRGADLRAMAFAGLGAAALVRSGGGSAASWSVLEAASAAVFATRSSEWIWPEDRLGYANGVLPHVLLAAGAQQGRRDYRERGLELLRFLLDVESAGGRDELGRRRFDQRPIEAAALAEACACAFDVTGDPTWLVGLESAWGWFAGRNESRGAESTIAALATQQLARRFGVCD